MALTREERRAFEELTKRVRKLETKLNDLEDLIQQILDMLARIDSETNMADWNSEQWRDFLRPFILELLRSSKLPIHDHRSNNQGGDCFANLGATLIE